MPGPFSLHGEWAGWAVEGGATMNDAGMTERQKKWFATVRANFTAQTGRTLGVG